MVGTGAGGGLGKGDEGDMISNGADFVSAIFEGGIISDIADFFPDTSGAEASPMVSSWDCAGVGTEVVRHFDHPVVEAHILRCA